MKFSKYEFYYDYQIFALLKIEFIDIFQELRDISSMAMEHFDDKIVPGKNVHCNFFSFASLILRFLCPFFRYRFDEKTPKCSLNLNFVNNVSSFDTNFVIFQSHYHNTQLQSF